MPFATIEQQRAYHRDWYARNQSSVRARVKVRNRRVKTEADAYVTAYLAEHPCIDCGEADPIVLEFDHRDRAAKKFCISHGIGRKYPMADVVAEIEKCDVRCANCHRRKTYREMGYRNRD